MAKRIPKNTDDLVKWAYVELVKWFNSRNKNTNLSYNVVAYLFNRFRGEFGMRVRRKTVDDKITTIIDSLIERGLIRESIHRDYTEYTIVVDPVEIVSQRCN